MVKKISPAALIEKRLTFPGLAAIILGSITYTIYGITNYHFTETYFASQKTFLLGIASLTYSFNYLLMLGGGFVAGYLLTRKGQGRLFSAIAYAFLAVSVYFVLDSLRVLVLNPWQYPWDTYSFFLGPLVALIITIVIAAVLQRKTKQNGLASSAKWVSAIAFTVAQLYYLGQSIYFLVTIPDNWNTSDNPLYLLIGGFLISAVVLAIVAFIVLANIKSLADRLFYATFVANVLNVFYLCTLFLEPSQVGQTSNIFNSVVIVIVLIAAVLMLWYVRTGRLGTKPIRSKTSNA